MPVVRNWIHVMSLNGENHNKGRSTQDVFRRYEFELQRAGADGGRQWDVRV